MGSSGSLFEVFGIGGLKKRFDEFVGGRIGGLNDRHVARFFHRDAKTLEVGGGEFGEGGFYRLLGGADEDIGLFGKKFFDEANDLFLVVPFDAAFAFAEADLDAVDDDGAGAGEEFGGGNDERFERGAGITGAIQKLADVSDVVLVDKAHAAVGGVHERSEFAPGIGELTGGFSDLFEGGEWLFGG
jgi:hypothetical protein